MKLEKEWAAIQHQDKHQTQSTQLLVYFHIRTKWMVKVVRTCFSLSLSLYHTHTHMPTPYNFCSQGKTAQRWLQFQEHNWSWNKIKVGIQTSCSCFSFFVLLRLWQNAKLFPRKTVVGNAAWHSGSWWCTTTQSFDTSSWAVHKIIFTTTKPEHTDRWTNGQINTAV